MSLKDKLIEYFKTVTFEEWERGYDYNFYTGFLKNKSALLKRNGENLHSDELVDDIVAIVEGEK